MLKNLKTLITKLNNNSTYYSFLFIVIVFNSFISYENITFDLYFNHLYADYAQFFKTLDFKSFKYPNSTFPLWGYGIFHLFGENILFNLIFQQTFTFINLIILDKFIRKYKLLSNLYLFRLVILLSSTWFLFHTQMWPKSIASNILLLGTIFLMDYLKCKKINLLIYSAICFGLLHNFRSDYIYLSVLISAMIFLWEEKTLFKKLRASYFLLIQLIFLIPWMIFTFNQVGKPLLTSTNSGHVFFIGLGQLPGNIWKITPNDMDSLKTDLLIDKFGEKYKYLDYEAWNGIEENEFLKQTFFNLIKENPREWLKKCLFASRLLILDPFYVGNVGNFQKNKISNIKEIRKMEALFYSFKFKEVSRIINNTKWIMSFKELFQISFTVYTKIFGILVFLYFLIVSFLSTLMLINRKSFYSKIETLLMIMIFYQISISIFAFHMPVYNSSIYIIYPFVSYLLFQKYLSIKQ